MLKFIRTLLIITTKVIYIIKINSIVLKRKSKILVCLVTPLVVNVRHTLRCKAPSGTATVLERSVACHQAHDLFVWSLNIKNKKKY